MNSMTPAPETSPSPDGSPPRRPARHRAPHPARPARRRIVGIVAALAVALAGAVLPAVTDARSAEAAAPQTVVSLTFDDGNANQTAAVAALNSRGMKATFYIISGYIGAQNYLSLATLRQMKASGHEIGGHTKTHADLATLAPAAVKQEVCGDRAALSDLGFVVRSFAYPYASSTPANEAVVRDCGYRSARMLGDIRSRFGCSDCDVAETLPPANAMYTRALDQVDRTWTLADLKAGVTNAETTGGWVQFTFHDVCASGCGDLSVTPTVLNQFLTWLKPRATTNNTVVKTVGDAVGGTVLPVVRPTAPTAPGPGVNGIVNPSLETAGTVAAGGGTIASCWSIGGYGTNTAAFSPGAPARTGSKAQTITMSNYSSGDAKLLQTFDLGSCAPTVTPGRTYSLRGWYTSTTVTQYAIYVRNSAGAWQYWTSSPWFAASPTYTEAVWTTPAIPAGMTGISFGLSLFSNGTLTTDDYAIYDSVGAPAPVVGSR